MDQSGRRDVHWILVGKEGIYPDLPSLVAHFTVRTVRVRLRRVLRTSEVS